MEYWEVVMLIIGQSILSFGGKTLDPRIQAKSEILVTTHSYDMCGGGNLETPHDAKWYHFVFDVYMLPNVLDCFVI